VYVDFGGFSTGPMAGRPGLRPSAPCMSN
jgi:hypothetical protein